ncbi:MAG: 4a-hydroxytetrahydrobiopterin dehydratase [Chloroflexi bacterium]|nr:MAG: 4a-hydroxytetrahydrobiopterin dehydratase [Chloroflexota bacterium]
MATPPLGEAEITERLAQLPGWERDGDRITKTWQLDSYMAGLAFATAIGTIAEGFDHHPDLHIGWRKVTATFTTHDAGNKLSYKDFDVAAAIEALRYPPSE